jgi:hypothetical protein
MAREWLHVTVSTPPGGSSTLRVYAWRNLRSLGAYHLQQSVCLLPATARTTRAVTKLVTRLRAEGGQGDILRIQISDRKQEDEAVAAFQRERSDEYSRSIAKPLTSFPSGDGSQRGSG